jgi:hypothetical protein
MDPMIIFLRVSDGINFKNSKHPFWRTNICWKKNLENKLDELKSNQELVFCFITCKQGNEEGKVVGFSTYIDHHNLSEGKITSSHKISNKEQGWIYPDEKGISDLHIDYKNLYRTKDIFRVSIQGPRNMIPYTPDDLTIHMKKDQFLGFYHSLSKPTEKFVDTEEDLEDCQRKLDEERAELQKRQDDLEKKKKMKEFKKWCQSEEGFQYYLKRQKEDIEKIQSFVKQQRCVCQINFMTPTRESWNDLSEEDKRCLYSFR